MNLLSGLWTILLWPLSLAGVIALIAAVDHKAWLTTALVGLGLSATLARMILSTYVDKAQREYISAAGAVWRGEQLQVHVGLKRPVRMAVGGCVGFSIAWLFPGGFRWAILFGSLVLVIAAIGRLMVDRGVQLQITRKGVWDPQQGWVRWDQVKEVRFSDYHDRYQRPRESSLTLELREGGAIQYDLSWLGVVPERAYAAARALHRAATAGSAPSMQSEKMKESTLAETLHQAQRRMGSASRLLVASYALVPVALVADAMLGGRR